MVAPLINFYGKIWADFCHNTGKRFSLEPHFKANRKGIGYSGTW